MNTSTRDRPHCGDIWMCNLSNKDGACNADIDQF